MTSLPPRPKPWETNGNATASSSTLPAKPSTSAFDIATSNASTAPRLPDRPAGLGDGTITTTGYSSVQPSNIQSRYGASSYGMSPYSGLGGIGGIGTMGGYGSYSSPYNRMGGGYGGYGGGYGMGGMGGYGVGGMGIPGEGFPSLTSSLQNSTAPAFAVLESLVTAFTSLAQLVESTYMATHSSFFAMVGVADQLGSLKTYLGQVLGVFSILRLGRRIINWLKGKKALPSSGGWVNEWATHPGSGSSVGSSGTNGSPPRPSSKPLILFLLSAVGLPYLMSKLVRLLIATTQQQQLQENMNSQIIDGTIDPSKLTFARAKWEFKPSEEWELALARDEIVAVLERRDNGANSEQQGWWRGRTRDGRVGWFPGNYVEVIKKREPSHES